MFNITSNDLLSYDFIHDNDGQLQFFRSNDVYNLDTKTMYRIDMNLLVDFNVEKYVQDIMLNNTIIYTNNNTNTTFTSTQDLIPINYKQKYVIMFDNMQCTIENIMNIIMLLKTNDISIYIPFILCCENIRSPEYGYNDDRCTNILGSYENLKQKLQESNINVEPCDFFRIHKSNMHILKKNYKLESILIGFDYDLNKLLQFRDIKKIKICPEIIQLLTSLKNILCKTQNIDNVLYDTIYNEFVHYIDDILDDKNNDDKLNKLNKIKALIYSMKEMRDVFYIKEIIAKKFDNVIFCTSDVISSFRAILNGISTINIGNNNIKYISMCNVMLNNKQYVLYKQISPSYYYGSTHTFDNIKQNMFDTINNINTSIIIKEQTGGVNKKHMTKTSNYFLSCINMDYNKIRGELFIAIKKFINTKNNFIYDDNIIYDQLKSMSDTLEMSTSLVNNIVNLYESIELLHIFCRSYDINVLKCIDFSCKTLTQHEKDAIQRNRIEFFDIMNNIKLLVVDNIDSLQEKIKKSTFYYDKNYVMHQDELFYTLLLSYIGSCDKYEREMLGYIMKILLNDYEYKLIRNMWSIFIDDQGYNKLIRGEHKLVTTFDENQYKFIEKVVHDTRYDKRLDAQPTEKFEHKIESQYNIICQKLKNIKR